MKANYKITQKAQDNLYRIWLYGCKQWGVAQADRYRDAFLQQFSEIAAHPMRYPSVDEVHKGYRRCVYEKKSIYYRIVGKTVTIVNIIGQQDIEKRL